MTPSIPVIVLNQTGLPSNSRVVSMKKSIAKLRKTNCNARFAFRVPKSIANVNMPHMKKYAAIEASLGAANPGTMKVIFGKTSNRTSDHQKKPYELKATVPKVLPFLY